MNAIAKPWPGSQAKSPAADAKRQKLILIGLMVVLLALLAFQLPKLLKGSGGSTAAPAETPVAVSPSVDPAASPATPSPAVKPGPMPRAVARDPFAPLLSEESSSSSSGSSTASSAAVVSPAPAAPASSKAPAASSAPAASAAPMPSTAPPVRTGSESPSVPAGPTAGAATPSGSSSASAPGSDSSAPSVVPIKVVPTVGVIWANGSREAVAVSQVFQAGDLWFRLLALGSKTVKIAVVDGTFTDGRDALTISRNKPVTLVNTATGVEYKLQFTLATSGIPTTSLAEPAVAGTSSATPAAPAASTPADATATPTAPPTATQPSATTQPSTTNQSTTTTPSGS